ncbi:MAG: peptide-N-glycosidase F-related protein [Bacteroidetes bacterium]|nr:peptide-N-glycosidase F-related protein [Bacteroidota bacterium]
MKKYIPVIVLICLFLRISADGWAGPGDTTTVQAFTFGSALEGKFLFPGGSHRWSKILMEYTLKCNPAQVPACGEWDYLTYTYLYKHTGQWDSTRYSHANFSINGETPDSLMYMNSGSWSYIPYFDYFNQTLPVTTVKTGDSTGNSRYTFSNDADDARSQFIYTAAELTQAGLQPGQVTGLRFKFSMVGSALDKLRVRLRNTAADTLNPQSIDAGGFTEVLARDWKFASIGWQTLPFTYPFQWDGVSNILVDISYEHRLPGGWNETFSGNPGHAANVSSGVDDGFLKFRDMDFVEVPEQVFSSLDSAVTIAFWQYGDPLLQPQNNTLFEGIDSAGRRVLNVHLPWSDGKVYWDAGRDSTVYDRIVLSVSDPSKYRGKWNHWAFSKDVIKGRMKIYLNGQLVFTQGSRHRPIDGIRKFRIGSDGFGTSNFYDGYIDEFSIWNKALSDTAIRAFMYKDIANNNPDYQYLLAYYHFNSVAGFKAFDAAPGGHDATLGGYPEWLDYKGKDLFRNFSPVNDRPCIAFEQGAYNAATLDSTFKVDTLAKSPVMIVLFGDTVRPYLPTDTLARYPAWYANYHYNSLGVAIDSSLVTPDGILHRKDYYYYGKPFESLERYELARYITPYGNNLSLGTGWTWLFDLTDYAPLLRDSVHLSAGNWQELLDMKFRLIEGVPPRDVLGIQNIYSGNHGYADASQHNLPPVKVHIGSDVRNARLKMRITGHGFGGNLDCSEFCSRTNELKINGVHAYNHLVWRADCGLNPLYPQGGTWLYDRAEWCPGAEVRTKNFELSHLIVPGDSMTIDYDLQPGYTWNGQGSWPYYAIESQLITYDRPNFKLDAALEEVLSPSNDKLYNRYNPLCGRPFIAIKNNGSDTLKSLVVTFGPVGGTTQSFAWTGRLAFQDTTRILLPAIDWTNWTGGDNRFLFHVKLPNGGTDENAANDAMSAAFTIPPTYNNQLVLKFKSNHMAGSLSWELADQDGNMVYQNGPLENNTIYQDTFNLPKGCYRLILRNAEGEGLNYWANMPPYGNGTAGYAQLKDISGQLVKSFQGDFGREIAQSFTVGMTIDVPELNPSGYVNIYPNPTQGRFDISLILGHPQKVTIMVADAMGNLVNHLFLNAAVNSTVPMDLTSLPAGIYFVTVTTETGTTFRKIVKY